MTSNFSSVLHHAMDCIGFSREMILSRNDSWRKMIEIINKNVTEHFMVELILAGSKSEGVAQIFESDFDMMFIPTHYVCVDNGCPVNDVIVFEARANDCPPGYTQLRIINDDNTNMPDILYMASEYDILKDVFLLKSTGFQRVFALVNESLPEYDGIETQCSASKGPSCPIISNRTDFFGITSAKQFTDHVLAITYYSSLILSEWKERVRKHEWPSPSLIEDVSTMEGYVVPVGHKFSEEQNFEWRICYTTAERELIISLNETQLKLYVVLKMVNKDVIKPVVDCVTSYMIKNIVLWMTECSPQDVQCHYNLTRMFIQSLRFLLHCLYNNHLPNYMIPSRNLLLGKIETNEKQTLIQFINELLIQGECVVLRCPKLKNSMDMVLNHTSLASPFECWRNEIERLIFAINLKQCSKMSPGMAFRYSYLYDAEFELLKDESYLVYLLQLFALLNIDISTLFLNGMQNFQDLFSWIVNFLS